jgi:hypothetical protein
MKTPTTHYTKHPNYPDERGRGTPHPDELSADTRASMERAWRDAEEREARIQAATHAAYARFLMTNGGK